MENNNDLQLFLPPLAYYSEITTISSYSEGFQFIEGEAPTITVDMRLFLHSDGFSHK